MTDASRETRGLGDTIVAVSSPRGSSPRGIVRLSGDRAVEVAGHLFEPAPTETALTGVAYGVSRGRLVIGRSGVAAPVLAYVMRAPRSYTREDQVELHLAGSPVLLECVVELARRFGARPAHAGEFTLRAFLNGRLDLTRCEAVAAVIHAHGEEERKAALTVLDGAVARRLHALAEGIKEVLTPLELAIDFSDQDIEIVQPATLADDVDELIARAGDVLLHASDRARHAGRRRLLLTGRANAGKSSLFNALLGDGRALVSPMRGTTRDYLEGRLRLGETDVTLVDTAGDDVSESPVDASAHRLRDEEAAKADLVVRVRDGRRPGAADAGGHDVVVCTRADLVPAFERTPEGGAAVHWTSAVTGEGLRGLRDALGRRLTGEEAGSSQALVHLQQRHRDGLTRAREALERGREAAAEEAGLELVAADLREALACLRELTGEDYTDQVLDGIMRHFCIGK